MRKMFNFSFRQYPEMVSESSNWNALVIQLLPPAQLEDDAGVHDDAVISLTFRYYLRKYKKQNGLRLQQLN